MSERKRGDGRRDRERGRRGKRGGTGLGRWNEEATPFNLFDRGFSLSLLPPKTTWDSPHGDGDIAR
jgi:hypothetical protein